ncbi:5-methylcytosine restriction system specificity protein McrC [Sharpea azabuensis]|uniref:5-methylcytosine restriction system specificity protein McrC n=1 Tax=Sharpea azabuensis TaxID=322505 RepID=UPI001566EFAB|nr:hypothetical protein [Sharpea azabuensis]
MLDEYRVVEVSDWSKISRKQLRYDDKLFCYKNANSCDCINLGLYLNERDEYCSCGYVGVCVLKDKFDEDYVGADGKKIIFKVNPRFKVNPWDMLATVMNDDEYEKYSICAEKRGERFYEIFDDEKPLPLNVEDSGGEILLAISCIRACYKVCTGTVKRKMDYVQENLNGKIRGRVDFANHIKKNVVTGREDRIFCKYPAFSEDTIENQILKQSILLSERILKLNNCLEIDGLAKIREMLLYCKRRLSKISDKNIRKPDYLAVNTRGFNSAYTPAVKLAEMLLTHSNMCISAKGDKTGFVVPFAVRMETIFEYYARTVIKNAINNDKKNELILRVDKYRDISEFDDLLKTTNNRDIYLMSSYIPDIAIQHYNNETKNWEYTTVLDVKYQRSVNPRSETVRHNSHQLLFYTLLLNTKECGFVFPEEPGLTDFFVEEKLLIQDGDAQKSDRFYSEFHIGYNELNREKEIKRIITYVNKLYRK